jgi:hypothetical protein
MNLRVLAPQAVIVIVVAIIIIIIIIIKQNLCMMAARDKEHTV